MKSFKKYFLIKASPEAIYNAITNKDVIELWTDSEVVMESVENSEFSLYDGDIIGKNLLFEKDKKVVQEWYFGNPSGQESIVTIKLHLDKKGTSVEISHTNIPEEAYDNITEGWDFGYIEPIKELLEEEE